VTAFYLIFAVGVLVIAAVGTWIYFSVPTGSDRFQDTLDRFLRIRNVCVAELGRYLGALVILLSGAAAAVIICWPFGRFARRFVSDIDAPFLRWTQSHVVDTGVWHHFNSVATNMGNRPVIKFLVPLGAVVLAALWAKRGFWIPLIIVPLSYVFEKFGQTALAKVADRPKVNLPGFGDFPSGGCARLLVIYGVIWYMTVLTFPAMKRWVRVGGFTVIGILAFVEGYTRVFLIKHWGLDVVGGWLYGTLMLLAFIAAASCFRPRAGFDEDYSADDATAGLPSREPMRR
jgi:membrane-associated phospholipid phosphatase